MANESIVYGIDGDTAGIGNTTVTAVTTGSTLTGNNDIEVRILKATFVEADNKGFNTKEQAIKLLEVIKAKIVSSNWPLGGSV